MDLFYQQGTLEEKFKEFKRELKIYAATLGFKLNKQFKVIYGTGNSIGNNLFIVMPPADHKTELFKGREIDHLLGILKEYNISNFFITYSSLFPYRIVGRKEIASFSYWIKLMIDIVQPHTIAVLGEQAAFTFVKRKLILKDTHGKVLDYHNQIPIIPTYHMSYYINGSMFEDLSYKEFLKNHDWSVIEKRYRRITK